ncbi:uncharacterized protein PAC_17660 [Phialocephala subalpina]|uniref:Auxin Efflux Carrier superfamily n=1 Tax=Phialocephala subalpina TaxID=576137 RepID=A0A1L7XRR6_9HELO|nr:uncharacterized protein PAC_17660 [Phialocephala subalpina]
MSDPNTGLIPSFLAAIQASLSVLLVIGYGSIAARFKLLTPATTSQISKICVRMFLPALLLTQIGSELHLGSAHRYVAILLWAFFCHLVSFFIGVGAHFGFGMEDWITAALMFNNTTSYPLLLIQSLNETGILGSLIITDESTKAAIERAKSYFLVFATVSSCLTFAIGPRLIDSEHAPEMESIKELSTDEGFVEGHFDAENGAHEADEDAAVYESDEPASPTDQTHLLAPPSFPGYERHNSVASLSFFPSRRLSSIGSPGLSPMRNVREVTRKADALIYDRRPSVIPKPRWRKLKASTKWWLLLLSDFLNAPLLGAVLGAFIGLIPALHVAFFSPSQDGGIFTAWLTASLKNIGSLFVPLPVVVAGVSLYTSYQATKRGAGGRNTPWATTAFILVIRFVVWPVMSIAIVWFLVKETTWLGEDPMLWFTMMLMPTGPPAMKLITMIQVSDADEEDEAKVAKLLTISYIISPVLAFTVVGSLKASQAAIGS